MFTSFVRKRFSLPSRSKGVSLPPPLPQGVSKISSLLFPLWHPHRLTPLPSGAFFVLIYTGGGIHIHTYTCTCMYIWEGTETCIYTLYCISIYIYIHIYMYHPCPPAPPRPPFPPSLTPFTPCQVTLTKCFSLLPCAVVLWFLVLGMSSIELTVICQILVRDVTWLFKRQGKENERANMRVASCNLSQAWVQKFGDAALFSRTRSASVNII